VQQSQWIPFERIGRFCNNLPDFAREMGAKWDLWPCELVGPEGPGFMHPENLLSPVARAGELTHVVDDSRLSHARMIAG